MARSPKPSKFVQERRFRLKLMLHCRKTGRIDFLKKAQASAAKFRCGA